MRIGARVIFVLLVTCLADSMQASTPIDIPAGVFVALAVPDRGVGPRSESKHVTWAHNPENGRLYSLGGDFDVGEGLAPQSYRQDQYSISIAERWAQKANPNAGWRQEYPYCGPDGGAQPKSPDFVGWTWDSNRRVFWFVPGTSVIPGEAVCDDRTVSYDDDPKYKMNWLMTFDPSENVLSARWNLVAIDPTDYRGENWMSVHDPVTDTLIRFGDPEIVDIYDIATDSWRQLGIRRNAVGGEVQIYDDMLSVDYVGRLIYAIDGTEGRLMAWDMDRKSIRDLGEVPDGPIPQPGNGYSVWDSVNRVLIFFHKDSGKLHVYDPTDGSWETPTIGTDPPGLQPAVRHAMVFDPGNNVTVFLGNTDEANRRIYLYRYAENAGLSPSPPVSLRVD